MRRLLARSRSARQARRPRRSVAEAWSTCSPATAHSADRQNSRNGKSCVSGFWSLSDVETRALIPTRMAYLIRFLKFSGGLLYVRTFPLVNTHVLWYAEGMRKKVFRIADVAHLGGIARRERLSAEERSESARHAVQARHKRSTKRQRQDAARKAVLARWARVKQQQKLS